MLKPEERFWLYVYIFQEIIISRLNNYKARYTNCGKQIASDFVLRLKKQKSKNQGNKKQKLNTTLRT